MSDSTYIRSSKSRLPEYRDCPDLLREFLRYLVTIRGLSVRTANTYYLQIRQFLRFMMTKWGRTDPEEDPENIRISDISDEDFRTVTRDDILDYLYNCTRSGDSITTRSTKLSSLRSFFDYLFSEIEALEHNPAAEIKRPKLPKRDPKFLTASESLDLLDAARERKYAERDTCISVIFLHCGLRLSELVSLNVSDFNVSENGTRTVRVVGKGNKERTIYLNDAVLSSLSAWLKVRASYANLIDRDALFISERTGKRLSNRQVQKIISQELNMAGLGNRGFSVHKLRHTAATLLYDSGADILQLKEILGHENISTTEIYTHLNQKKLQEVTDNHPLNTARKRDKDTGTMEVPDDPDVKEDES